MDNDSTVLEDSGASVIVVDQRYRAATPSDKLLLKPERDRAFNTYSAARLKLLEDGVICTDDDVQAMKQIRQEIERAIQTQSLLIAIGRLVGFLVKVARP